MYEQLFEDIRNKNEIRWGTDRLRIVQRLGREIHAEATDLIVELIQNAEDAQATCIGLRVLHEGLIVWND